MSRHRLGRGSRRPGFTLLELLLAAGLALVLLAGTFELLVGLLHAEKRTDRTADVAEQCAQAFAQVSRDLRGLLGSEDFDELVVEAQGLRFPLRDREGSELGQIEYRFRSEPPRLERWIDGELMRGFDLGPEGTVHFARTVQAEKATAPILVQLLVRARDPEIGSGVELSMRGAVPLIPRISRLHFPYWNAR